MTGIRSHVIPWLQYLWRRFIDDECMRSAAALTYMSLFALVPLMTVMYAMLSAIPDFQGVADKFQDLLFDNLFPAGSSEQDAISVARQQVQGYLSSFSQQARNLTGPGVGLLMVVAILMLRNVETAFNVIWRTHRNRSAIASFLLYWAVLSLGPILVGLAFGISNYLVIVDRFVEEYDVIGVGRLLLETAPILLTAAAFSLLYAAVPNCRVTISHAVIGGLVTALVFDFARGLFTLLVVKSSYTAVYGAFAAFPLLLLWIYVSWNIVLGGGVLVHSLSSYRHEAAVNMPPLIKALIVLQLLWQHHQRGESIGEFELLQGANGQRAGLASDTWRRLSDVFLRRRLVQIDEKGRYLLSRDLDQVSYWQLKEWVNAEIALEDIPVEATGDWKANALDLLRSQRQQQRDLMQITLADLFRQ